jgi:hypothetical protein
LALLAAFTLGGCTGRGSAADEAERPLASRRHDAGKVLEGTTIEHVFALENTSSRPFRITKVSTSCQCIRGELAGAERLAPGERSALRAEFDTRGQTGLQTKTITVETDSPEAEWKTVDFRLEALVLRRVQSVPENLFFGTIGREQQPKPKYLAIEINDPVWQGVVPKIASAGSQVVVTPHEAPGARLARYEVRLVPSASNGPLAERIVFLLEKEGQRLELTVPVQADVTGLLRVAPRRIVVSQLEMSLGKQQRLRIASSQGRPFSIVDVKLPAGVSLVGSPNAGGAARSHDLEIAIDGPRLPTGGGQIVVQTDVQDGRIEVPVVVGKDVAKLGKT